MTISTTKLSTFGILGLTGLLCSLLPESGAVASRIDPEYGDTIEIHGVVRDFHSSHPDFDVDDEDGFGYYADLMELSLDDDGKPALHLCTTAKGADDDDDGDGIGDESEDNDGDGIPDDIDDDDDNDGIPDEGDTDDDGDGIDDGDEDNDHDGIPDDIDDDDDNDGETDDVDTDDDGDGIPDDEEDNDGDGIPDDIDDDDDNDGIPDEGDTDDDGDGIPDDEEDNDGDGYSDDDDEDDDNDEIPDEVACGTQVQTQYRDSQFRPIAPFLYENAWGGFEPEGVDPMLGPCGSVNDTPGTMGTPGSAAISSQSSFNQWFHDALGTNISEVHSIELVLGDDGVYEYLDDSFHPIDHQLFGNEGELHNEFFTYTFTASFTYVQCTGQFIEFAGGDGAWMYLNNNLAMDLGGIQPQTEQYVDMDRMGLIDGQEYKIRFYYAQRSDLSSVFRLRTNIFLAAEQPETVTLPFD